MSSHEHEDALALLEQYGKLFKAECLLRKKILRMLKDGEPIPDKHRKLSERIKQNILWGI